MADCRCQATKRQAVADVAKSVLRAGSTTKSTTASEAQSGA